MGLEDLLGTTNEWATAIAINERYRANPNDPIVLDYLYPNTPQEEKVEKARTMTPLAIATELRQKTASIEQRVIKTTSENYQEAIDKLGSHKLLAILDELEPLTSDEKYHEQKEIHHLYLTLKIAAQRGDPSAYLENVKKRAPSYFSSLVERARTNPEAVAKQSLSMVEYFKGVFLSTFGKEDKLDSDKLRDYIKSNYKAYNKAKPEIKGRAYLILAEQFIKA